MFNKKANCTFHIIDIWGKTILLKAFEVSINSTVWYSCHNAYNKYLCKITITYFPTVPIYFIQKRAFYECIGYVLNWIKIIYLLKTTNNIFNKNILLITYLIQLKSRYACKVKLDFYLLHYDKTGSWLFTIYWWFNQSFWLKFFSILIFYWLHLHATCNSK